MIRFGIAGTGRISEWVLAGAILDPRFKATAVCSRDERTAFAFIGRHPEWFDADTRVFVSIEEMAACPEVDAIYIGTPNTTHFDYAKAALNAGKHVLCEKPMACDASQVEELCSLALGRGLLLMEAMVSTLQPPFRALASRLSGIGPLRHVSASFLQYSSKYEALQRGEMASAVDPAMGGGALEDIGIYTIYPLVSLFGAPDRIGGAQALMFPTAHGPIDLQGSAVLHFPGSFRPAGLPEMPDQAALGSGTFLGFDASLSWSKICDGFAPGEFCGEGGNLLLDSIHVARRTEYYPHGTPSSGRGERPGASLICSADGTDPYFWEWKEFLDTLQSGRSESPVNSLEVSLTTRRVMDSIKDLFCGT